MTGFPASVWVVGCGNMGGAILGRWLDAGLPREHVTVIDPSPSRLPEGICARDDYPPFGNAPELVLLAVKPQQLDAVAGRLAPLLDKTTMLVSILAGIDLARLRARFAGARQVVRLMPNMAVSLGKGTMMLADDPALAAADRRRLETLLAPCGEIFWFTEDLIPAATALAGSGPAFLFRFIDALAVGGAELGLPAKDAARLALAMTEGAALLAAGAEDAPGTLADRVASPGGVTREGLNVLDRDGDLRNLLLETLTAARDRDIAMGKEFGG